ncbi:MAG TPA: DNA-processing protein DprA [Candidatus Saccharimonadales bacterium]|nr:DNA-processing protein DprA [Candidatus Saccharimonadales bacterium]
MNIQHIILHLSLIQNLTPRLVYEIIETITLEKLSDLYQYNMQDFIKLGCSQDIAHLIVAGLSDTASLDKELELVQQHNVTVVTFVCPQYPALLKQIDVAPLVLYCQGDVRLFDNEKMFACVGARKAHSYVRDALVKLVVPMIQDEWVIVSGGAAGADTYAHQIALDHKGKTIVVVGSGLCHVYPPANRKLFEQVVYDGGLIVSCFPMNMASFPYNFPIRNRIISGLSKGCLVLQAASKSGALITAHFALEQGREVFAVPGSIFDPLSAGCHDLLQQGAKLVTCTQDILDELSYPGKVTQVQMKIQSDTKVKDASSGRDGQVGKSKSSSIGSTADLDDIERSILHYTIVPVTAEMLMSKVGVSLDILQSKLFSLSLDGKIYQDTIGLWKRV